MCGIAGAWGQANDALVGAMIAKQEHRGPDGHGFHSEEEHGALAHVRLSIIDPTGGDQPMYNEDRTVILVGNGEVYNHQTIRDGLAATHQFASGSDMETVLHLFEERGPSAAATLDGMFAVAVAQNDGDLFVARDPIGIKPLYYGIENEGQPDETFYFSSELKAIAQTVVDVHEFPPGSYYRTNQGFQSYYDLPRRSPTSASVEEHARTIRETLEAAIVKRLMSDAPLGAFLSGGLDSSIIAALARRNMDELHTFSVGVAGSRDLKAAQVVADHIGSIHHEYAFTPEEALAKLPEIIYYLESFDQDLVRSAIPTYFCARLAAERVKVILTGEGADELFAGYTYHKDFAADETLQSELHRSIGTLHNLNLQRVDRMTMRHSIEGRVPFLDIDLIELAQSVPPELKLKTEADGRRVEKWILRKACEDLLPYEIVWRGKEQFDEGSGTVDIVDLLVEKAGNAIDYAAYTARYPQYHLRSVEECMYHSILADAFDDPEPVLRNVGRWKQEYA